MSMVNFNDTAVAPPTRAIPELPTNSVGKFVRACEFGAGKHSAIQDDKCAYVMALLSGRQQRKTALPGG